VIRILGAIPQSHPPPHSSFLLSSFCLLVSTPAPVSSTLCFSSACKIFRTNDAISLNTSTIVVFDNKIINEHGRDVDGTLPRGLLAKGLPRAAGAKGPAKPTRSPRLPTPLFPLLLLSPTFRILFQVPYPATPLFALLRKLPGCVPTIPNVENSPAHSKGTLSPRLYSSSFFSNSCALFCTEKLNSFLFNRFRTLCSKTPGVGYPPSLQCGQDSSHPR